MMPVRTQSVDDSTATDRTRPEPAGESAPTTVDPAPTPEDEHSEEFAAIEPEETPAMRERVERIRAAANEVRIAEGRELLPTPGRLAPMPESAYGPDAVDLEPPPLTAAEALAEVMRRVQPIAKAREAEPKAGGYRFRGIDDVYAALHDLFAEVGLVVLPSTLEREREQRPRASGSGYNYVTHVRVRLRFLAQDGSSEELDVWGEGADTGDKSTGKAYSQGIKSALLAAFLIPTETSAADDPDRTNTEESRAFTPEEIERASTALLAAREATTFDALVNVRRRAAELLTVPITASGVLAPLDVHLDAIRRRLESRVPGEQS